MAIPFILFQVATARNDIRIEAGVDKTRDALGLMLTIAVERYQILVIMFDGITKSRLERCSVTAVGRVADHLYLRPALQVIRRLVAGAIVDDQHVFSVLGDLCQNSVYILRLVVDRQSSYPFFRGCARCHRFQRVHRLSP